jgi:hypothetical protein
MHWKQGQRRAVRRFIRTAKLADLVENKALANTYII